MQVGTGYHLPARPDRHGHDRTFQFLSGWVKPDARPDRHGHTPIGVSDVRLSGYPGQQADHGRIGLLIVLKDGQGGREGFEVNYDARQ